MKDYREVIKAVVKDLCDKQCGYSPGELSGAAIALCVMYDLQDSRCHKAVKNHLKRECDKYERMSTPLSQQLKAPFAGR